MLIIVAVFTVSGCTHKRTLDDFKNPVKCFDRKTEPLTFAVDAHMHFRPYGGEAIPFSELNEYFNETGVLFVNAFGIGQMFAAESGCQYYLDQKCWNKTIKPTVRNDFVNASNYYEFLPKGVKIILAMSFADLSDPTDIVETIALYEKEYPNTFKWAGELNLVKQAIVKNGVHAVAIDQIPKWAAFMELLRYKNIPVTLHADLGWDPKEGEKKEETNTKYKDRIETVASTYPNNVVVWAHMGLSKELKDMDVGRHIEIMEEMFKKYPNLYVDVSWKVLWDDYFSKKERREQYVQFFNRNPTRILPGTDFVASREKNFSTYKEELSLTSKVFEGEEVSDEAFRNIVLGENYFRLLRDADEKFEYSAPMICD
jgi:hypothetical protein